MRSLTPLDILGPMARVPGTEHPLNRVGLIPSQRVRARRMKANGDLGISDHQGFVTEVRPSHVRVLFSMEGNAIWLASDRVTEIDSLSNQDLECIRQIHHILHGHRMEREEDQIIIYSESFPAGALEQIQKLLNYPDCKIFVEAEGVHELAVRITF